MFMQYNFCCNLINVYVHIYKYKNADVQSGLNTTGGCGYTHACRHTHMHTHIYSCTPVYTPHTHISCLKLSAGYEFGHLKCFQMFF